MKLQLLKIKFPSVFGYPRAGFILDEVKQMIDIVERGEIKIKNNIMTTSFDVNVDLNGKKYMDNFLKNELKEKKESKCEFDMYSRIYD